MALSALFLSIAVAFVATIYFDLLYDLEFARAALMLAFSLIVSTFFVFSGCIFIGQPAFLLARKLYIHRAISSSFIGGALVGMIWTSVLPVLLGIGVTLELVGIGCAAGCIGGLMFWALSKDYREA